MSIAELIEAVEAGTADAPDFHKHLGRNALNAISAYNGSLDAALALHNALLPGWDWDVASSNAAAVFKGHVITGPAELAASATTARAWLLAILRAKEAGQ